MGTGLDHTFTVHSNEIFYVVLCMIVCRILCKLVDSRNNE